MLTVTPRQRPNSGAPLSGRRQVDWFLVAFKNRKLLSAIVQRDLSSRYRGSALGLAWLVGIPLTMMLAYTFVFGGIFKVRFDQGHVPTSLAIWAGTLTWQILNESISRSVSILHDNAPYVKRVPFPLALLPLMPLGTALIGGGVSLALFAIAYCITTGSPPSSWLYVPCLLSILVLVAAGTCWLAATLGAYMRDFRHVVPLGMTLLMFVTPVLYPLSAVPAKLTPVVGLNPLAYLFEVLRRALLGEAAPGLPHLGLALALAILYTIAGYSVFVAREWEYADVI